MSQSAEFMIGGPEGFKIMLQRLVDGGVELSLSPARKHACITRFRMYLQRNLRSQEFLLSGLGNEFKLMKQRGEDCFAKACGYLEELSQRIQSHELLKTLEASGHERCETQAMAVG